MLPHFDVVGFFLFSAEQKNFSWGNNTLCEQKRVFLLSQKVPFFFYPPDSCQIICFAVSELQPTFISILDVYQRNDPVSAMQDYSSSFILNSARKKDPRTDEKRDVHSDKLPHRYTRINPI